MPPGLRKPDAAIYSTVAERLGETPSALIVVDDRPRNCEAARSVGMRALCFLGDAQQLAAELSALLESIA